MKTKTLVHVGGRMSFCPSEILMLKCDANYTRVHFKDGKVILTSTNLGKLEPRFAGFNFFRASRQYMINLDFMANYELKTNSIKMKNKETIQMSRSRAKQFTILKNLIPQPL